MSELALFLEGSKLVGKVELSPPVFLQKNPCQPGRLMI
jgi:hypothetical protein